MLTVRACKPGVIGTSVDHLFLDAEGFPTLVEVKRRGDTRLRREVVGQMLDYAANAASYWTAESIRAAYEHTCEGDGVDADEHLHEAFTDVDDPEDFWQSCARTSTPDACA